MHHAVFAARRLLLLLPILLATACPSSPPHGTPVKHAPPPPDPLLDRGTPQTFSGAQLSGIMLPVGGIGTGHVGIDGTASRNNWWITGESNGIPEIAVPDSFFGIMVKAGNEAPDLRALQTVGQGRFLKLDALTFRGEYPFGWYEFSDATLPVKLSLETFNPLIPGDVKSSAIPCAIYTFTVENRSNAPVDVSLIATQQNLIGDGIDSGFGQNVNEVIRDGTATLLHLSSQRNAQGRYHGDLALMTTEPTAAATASFAGGDALAAQLVADGTLLGPPTAGPTPDGQTIAGALAVPFTLAPKDKRSVTFVLTWHFPNRVAQWGNDPVGPKYANWWASALDVARFLETNLATLGDETRHFHDTLYASKLPYWYLNGLSSQIAILRSPVLFWNKDDFVGLYEGYKPVGYFGSGFFEGNCLHVTHYGQLYAALFPDLARRIREVNYARQRNDGSIPNRTSELRPPADGMCGEILSTYREHLSSPDQRWLDTMWPGVKAAMQYIITTWDTDGDGMVDGCQYDTYDTEICGNNTFVGSLYLAALAATEAMATLEGDASFADTCKRLRFQGGKGQDDALFNGSYYIHVGSGAGYDTHVFSDQLLGQWWATQLGLGSLYTPAHVATAAQTIFDTNYHPSFVGYRFARVFADPDEAGLVNSSGGSIPYTAEVWTGIEYEVSALLIQTGALREGLTLFKSVRERYDGTLDKSWFEPGGMPFQDMEFGSFYWRAQTNWSILTATEGLLYEGPTATLRFAPSLRPEDHRSFFAAANAWGTLSQSRQTGEQTDTIAVEHGTLPLQYLYLTVEDVLLRTATVSLDGVTLPSTLSFGSDGGVARIALAGPRAVAAGGALRVVLRR